MTTEQKENLYSPSINAEKTLTWNIIVQKKTKKYVQWKIDFISPDDLQELTKHGIWIKKNNWKAELAFSDRKKYILEYNWKPIDERVILEYNPNTISLEIINDKWKITIKDYILDKDTKKCDWILTIRKKSFEYDKKIPKVSAKELQIGDYLVLKTKSGSDYIFHVVNKKNEIPIIEWKGWNTALKWTYWELQNEFLEIGKKLEFKGIRSGDIWWTSALESIAITKTPPESIEFEPVRFENIRNLFLDKDIKKTLIEFMNKNNTLTWGVIDDLFRMNKWKTMTDKEFNENMAKSDNYLNNLPKNIIENYNMAGWDYKCIPSKEKYEHMLDKSNVKRFYLNLKQDKQHDIFLKLTDEFIKCNKSDQLIVWYKMPNHLSEKERFDEIIIYFDNKDSLIVENILSKIYRENTNVFKDEEFYIYSKSINKKWIYKADEPLKYSLKENIIFPEFWDKNIYIHKNSRSWSYSVHRLNLVWAIFMQAVNNYVKENRTKLSGQLGSKNYLSDVNGEKMKIFLEKNWNEIINQPWFKKIYEEMCRKFSVNPEDFSKNEK